MDSMRIVLLIKMGFYTSEGSFQLVNEQLLYEDTDTDTETVSERLIIFTFNNSHSRWQVLKYHLHNKWTVLRRRTPSQTLQVNSCLGVVVFPPFNHLNSIGNRC